MEVVIINTDKVYHNMWYEHEYPFISGKLYYYKDLMDEKSNSSVEW